MGFLGGFSMQECCSVYLVGGYGEEIERTHGTKIAKVMRRPGWVLCLVEMMVNICEEDSIEGDAFISCDMLTDDSWGEDYGCSIDGLMYVSKKEEGRASVTE